MKILQEEIKKSYEEKRLKKTSLWSNWVVKVIVFIIVVLLIRYLTNIHTLFQREPETEKIEMLETIN